MDLPLLHALALAILSAALAVGEPLERHLDNEASASDSRGVDAPQSDHPDPHTHPDQSDRGADAEFEEARNFDRRAFREDNYENDEDIVYDFSYEVKDPHSGNDFGHRQSRSNGITQGQYRILLPDGRMQVVDYVSDQGGFRPNVRYEDVGIAAFAGSENHEQFIDGNNHFDNSPQQQPGQQAATSDAAAEFERRRRRRR